MPVKTTSAGGYACRINVSLQIQRLVTSCTVGLTGATARRMAKENALTTFTVGSSHLVSFKLSLVLPQADWSSAGICCRSTVIISSGEEQVSSL